MNENRVRVSPYYFDWLASGVVRTTCTSVYSTAPEGSEPHDGKSGGTQDSTKQAGSTAPTSTQGDKTATPSWRGTDFRGVFCVDRSAAWTLDAETRHPILSDSPVFHVRQLCVIHDQTFEASDDTSQCSSGRRAELTPEEHVAILNATRSPTARGTAAPTASLLPIAATIQTYPESGASRVLLVKVRSREPDPVRLGAAGLAFVCATGLLLWASREADLLRAETTTLEVIRGLPVGVIRVDESGRIVLGNERAEELLGIALPITENDPPVHNDSKLFGDTIAVLRDGAERDPTLPEVELRTFDKHKDARALLRPWQYVATVRREPGRRLLVFASPMVEGLKGEVSSFGVLESVSEEEERRITDALTLLESGKNKETSS